MKSNKIFIGNIYHQQEIEQKNTILLQADNKKYLALEDSKNILNLLALKLTFLQNKQFISESEKENLYIKKDELRSYISKETTVDLKRVRKIHQKKRVIKDYLFFLLLLNTISISNSFDIFLIKSILLFTVPASYCSIVRLDFPITFENFS